MVRVYASGGWESLKPFTAQLGGRLTCLAPDNSGGCFAVFDLADSALAGLAATIPGAVVLPVDRTRPLTPAQTAPGSVYGVKPGDTLASVMAKVTAIHGPGTLYDPSIY